MEQVSERFCEEYSEMKEQIKQLKADLDTANKENERLREELKQVKRRLPIPVQGFVKGW